MKQWTYNSLVKQLTKKKEGKIQLVSFMDDYEDRVEVLTYVSHTTSEIRLKNSYGDSYYIDADSVHKVKKIKWVKKDFFQKMKTVTDAKVPKTQDLHVGIELEFISKLGHNDLKIMLVEAGLEENVVLKDDGSIDTEGVFEHSHEMCILATERTFARVVKKVCTILAKNSTVNESCGMHVHLDMRNRDKELAYKNLFSAQPLLYSMVPKSRREGTYSCFRDRYESFENGWGERYVGVNKTAFSTHKTIEIRIHSGSLNYEKIVNWVRLLIKIANGKQHIVHLMTDFALVKKQYRIGGRLEKYIKERLKKFEKQSSRFKYKVAV